jgi:hypothetical protein
MAKDDGAEGPPAGRPVMRLCEILPELLPQAWQRWVEIASGVPPHDPLRMLKYPGYIEVEAKAGNEIADAMLGLLDDMLRALIAAGIDGRITAEGLIGTEGLRLSPPHWLLLSAVAARELRRAIDPGNDRICLPGETTWPGEIWDHGETHWDVGIPETDIAVIKGVVISYVVSPALGSARPAHIPTAPEEPNRESSATDGPAPGTAARKSGRPSLAKNKIQSAYLELAGAGRLAPLKKKTQIYALIRSHATGSEAVSKGFDNQTIERHIKALLKGS